MEPARASPAALNVLPAHTPVRGSPCWGAELAPWRAAKSTCSLWLPEDVKTTAHFGLSVWGRGGGGAAGWGREHVQEGAVGFAAPKASHTHLGPRCSLTVETASVPELSSPELDTEDIHASPG